MKLKFHSFWSTSDSVVRFRAIFFFEIPKSGTEFEKFCKLYANIFRHLRQFSTWITPLFMIEYVQNLLISQWKGVTRNVHFKQHPWPLAESVFIHQSRQGTEPIVHLRHSGIHRPFYLFYFFEHSSVHQYPVWPKCGPASILHIHGIQQTSMG